MYRPTQKPSPEGGEIHEAYIDMYDADVANNETADSKYTRLLPDESPCCPQKSSKIFKNKGKLAK